MKTILLLVFFIISLFNIYSQKAVPKTMDDSSENKRLYKIKLISKPMLMPILALLYYLYTKELGNYNLHVMIALVFGWIGDVALMVKSKKIDAKIPLLIGLCAFLFGHITYTLLFLKSAPTFTPTNELYALIYIAYATYAIIIYTHLEKRADTSDESISKKTILIMKIAVIMYMLAITCMSFTSLLRLINLKSMPAVFTFIGSLIFITSDSVLSLKVLAANKKMSGQYIMGSYISAQVLIVLGYIL